MNIFYILVAIFTYNKETADEKKKIINRHTYIHTCIFGQMNNAIISNPKPSFFKVATMLLDLKADVNQRVPMSISLKWFLLN